MDLAGAEFHETEGLQVGVASIPRLPKSYFRDRGTLSRKSRRWEKTENRFHTLLSPPSLQANAGDSKLLTELRKRGRQIGRKRSGAEK